MGDFIWYLKYISILFWLIIYYFNLIYDLKFVIDYCLFHCLNVFKRIIKLLNLIFAINIMYMYLIYIYMYILLGGKRLQHKHYPFTFFIYLYFYWEGNAFSWKLFQMIRFNETDVNSIHCFSHFNVTIMLVHIWVILCGPLNGFLYFLTWIFIF